MITLLIGPDDEPLEDFLSDSEFMELCHLADQVGSLNLAIEYCEQNPNGTTDRWRRRIMEEFGR